MRRPRGFILISVLIVLVALAAAIEIGFGLLSSHLRETRRREEAGYSAELARSGVALGRACLLSGNASCSIARDVAGGRIVITVDSRGGVQTIRSEGRVVRNGSIVTCTVTASYPAAP